MKSGKRAPVAKVAGPRMVAAVCDTSGSSSGNSTRDHFRYADVQSAAISSNPAPESSPARGGVFQVLYSSRCLARGDVVMAKVASGQLVRRRVWSVSDVAVFLCSERMYSNLLIGATRLWPIGFPKSDVLALIHEA